MASDHAATGLFSRWIAVEATEDAVVVDEQWWQGGAVRTPAVEMQMHGVSSRIACNWKQLIASIADSQRTTV